MKRFASKYPQLLVLTICLHIFWLASKSEASRSKPWNTSGLYVFGDSTVDPGNNNYVKTTFRSNFLPYGRDFRGHLPTGRFSNGKLATDFIASYAGLKELVPPYLDPKLSIAELKTGVSFASAGSGFDPMTPTISGVIPMQKQLKYFRECKKKLETALGKQRVDRHIKNAVFLISAGTNDFAFNYFTLPMRRSTYSVLAYQQFLIQQVKDFIQHKYLPISIEGQINDLPGVRPAKALSAEGAKKIAVVGLPPVGCLPIMITLNSQYGVLTRNCIEEQSSVAREYNLMLQNELRLLQSKSTTPRATSSKLYYVDIYESLASMIRGLGNHGFEHFDTGCCGTGFLEASFLCNKISPVCDDAAKYVFWDSVHPSEKAYYQIFESVRNVIDFILNDEI